MPVSVPLRNRLEASLRNVGHVTIDVRRSRLHPGASIVLAVTSTHDAVVELAGPGHRRRIVAVRAGSHTLTVAPNGSVS